MSCHRVTRLIFTTLVSAAAVLAGATIPAAAQPPGGPPGAAADADPPSRVARISFISGSASFRPASLDEWTTATLNYPLSTGDHLWTDQGARAELDLGTVVIRVAPQTEFSILNLDDHAAQLRVTEGSVAVRVRERADDEDLEIDTPNGAADLLVPGNYRIDVNENGDASTVTVRHGEAEVTSADASYPVREAQAFVVNGTVRPTHNVVAAVPIDAFEDWAITRDRRAEHLQAAQYVSRGTIGYEDLDAYGTWRTTPDYGPVWVPRVDADWVPYRYGHWVWVQPWGWTWIDDAPWGFAPSHYGRWAYLPAGPGVVASWAWVPGHVVVRPVYAPAMVAFVGGANWHVALTAGTAPVGWFPLGPREPFVPAYRVTPAYVHAVNVTQVNVTTVNVTNITYVNREVPRAVTVVSRDTFVQARPVAAAVVAVPREELRAAVVVGHAPALAPERVSVVGHVGTAVRVAAPPAVVVNRQVVVRRMPPQSPPRTPFAAATRTAVVAPAPAPPPVVHVAPAPAPAPAASAPPRVVHVPPAEAPHAAPAPVPPGPPANAAETSHVRQPMPGAVNPADLAARHQRERNDFETRSTAERAQLNARHKNEIQAAGNQQAREQLRAQHQHEAQALQERQRNDREALQKRQANERQQAQHDHDKH